MLPDDLDARVRLEARLRGVSIADVARDALEQQLPPLQMGGRLSFFGVGEGGAADVSERAEEYVAKAVARRRRGDRP